MRRWALRAGVIATLGLAVWIVQKTFFAPEPVPVEVYSVTAGRVEATVTNSRAGTVKALRRARLSPEIGGQVVALPYREGDRVKAGEVILKLDGRLQEARLQLAARELEATRAQSQQVCLTAERAQRELRRMLKLLEEEIISVDLLDEVENAAQTSSSACEAAQATVARGAAAVDLARVELEKTVLKAPFDAVVAEISIELGEWTTPSPPALPVPPVIDLLDPASIYISAPMDEVDSARIFSGQEVRVTVDSYRGRTLGGSVIRVAPYVLDVEAQNRTVEIDVELDDPQFASGLLPGTSADVEVILEVREGVHRIPTSALFEGGKVLVVDGDERLVERKVEVGLTNWNFTQVLDGLEPGDAVVLSLDRPEVAPGAWVAVIPPAATE